MMEQPGNGQTTGRKTDDSPTDNSLNRSQENKRHGLSGNASVEEQLEKLAELNLSSTYASRSRFSPVVIRLLSAATGIAVLLLIYLCFKLFI